MSIAIEILISAFLVISGVFGLIGSFGLLKLRDAMQRLHAPTKATTIGVGAALIASALNTWLIAGEATWQEMMVSVFLFITAPLSALYLAKSHIATTVDRSMVPPTATAAPWAELRRAPKI
jgi:multicomponent K+:H+ antiporter subunit G